MGTWAKNKHKSKEWTTGEKFCFLGKKKKKRERKKNQFSFRIWALRLGKIMAYLNLERERKIQMNLCQILYIN